MSAADSHRSAAPAQLVLKSYLNLSHSSASEEDGKFVVLTKAKVIHLVLSPVTLTPYHANIVYQYLQAEGRGKVEAVSSSGCRILSKGWKIHGGGYYKVQAWLHNFMLHGKSTAFGKYASTLLEPFADEIPERLGLSGYTLEFG